MSHSHAKGYLLALANKPQIHGWFKDLIVKIINNNGDLSDSDLADTVNQLKKGSGAVLSIPVGDTTDSVYPIRLHSLKHIRGVCALKEGQQILFSKDITLLYGMNGSGKSSYFRILNEIAGGNRQHIIRHNIYCKQNPSVDIELSYEDQNGVHTISWDGTNRALAPLTGISVFDSSYTSSFLEKRSADTALVHPYGLYLFSSLTRAMDRINQFLQTEIDDIKENLPKIDMNDMSNMVQQVISKGQFDNNQKEYIEERFCFTEQQNEDLEQLNNQIKQLSETNYLDKIKLETAYQSQYEQLLTFIQEVHDALSEEIKQVNQVIDSIKSSRQKANETKAKISILQEIGNTESQEWKMFVKSADSYVRNSNLSDEICPYCRQNLNSIAKSILSSYAIFLNDNSILELDQEERKKEELVKAIDSLNTEYVLSDDFVNLIKNQDETLFSLICKVLSQFTNIKASLLQNLKEENNNPVLISEEIKKLISNLSEIYDNYTQLLSELKQKGEKRELLLKELIEKTEPLLERKSISEQKELFLEWFEDIKKINKLHSHQNKLSTRFVSNLSKSASKKLITDKLVQKFQIELEKLGLSKLHVCLTDTGATKGQNYMQLKLHNNYEVTDILSEGEQKGVALALFLAERQMEVTHNPIILDDPVNSLDHCVTSNLVERLSSLDNQIVIFSHNVLLKSTLINLQGLHECGANQYSSCKKDTRHLFLYKVRDYGRDQKGVVCEDKQDNVANQLSAVKKILEKQPFQDNDSISAAAQLRHIIELLIDEKIFNRQIPIEYHGRKNNIPWDKLKLLNPDVALIDKLNHLFNRLSGGSLHVGIEQTENPLDHAELESIYNELKGI